MLALSGAWTAEADVLADYVAAQSGRFTSEAQARQEAGYESVTWYVVEIWSDDDPARYAGAWRDTARFSSLAPAGPYRLRRVAD